jgi:hypothetical protein
MVMGIQFGLACHKGRLGQAVNMLFLAGLLMDGFHKFVGSVRFKMAR